MGHREARRVPLDFDWPLKKTWGGYLSPDWRACPSEDCENGSTLAGRWLDCVTHLLLMAGDAAVSDGPLHPWLREIPLAPARKPGRDMAELTAGLAGRPPRPPFGHDAIDRFSAAAKIVEAAGMPGGWGTCQTCHGHAIHPDDLEASENWQATEPPPGEGWQLWETVSDGSPISPVFATPEELAAWCESGATVFADSRWSAAQWLASFRDGSTDVNSLLFGDNSGVHVGNPLRGAS